MYRKTLATLYDYNLKVIEMSLEGITPEESFVQPQPGGNCINWVLGHIVANRNQIMELIGEDPVWRDEMAAIYRRGSTPLAATRSAIPLDGMLNDLRASQEKILKKLPEMPVENLEKSVGDQTIYYRLSFLQFHETYHAGQLGLLRRLLGKEGVIK